MLRDLFIKETDQWSEKPNKANVVTSTQTLPKARPIKKILLIDDDPIFGRIFLKMAQSKGKEVAYCESIDSLGNLNAQEFDVAIVDYDLGHVTGVELASYIEKFALSPMPIVLVSQSHRNLAGEGSQDICKFIHKSQGHEAIIEAAVLAAQKWQASNTVTKED
ncbi:response regulator [Oligoflexaceae bacterium]|nr:response regulator [Oligoflexaceae bacterium]